MADHALVALTGRQPDDLWLVAVVPARRWPWYRDRGYVLVARDTGLAPKRIPRFVNAPRLVTRRG